MNKTATCYQPLRTSADLSGNAVRIRRCAPPPDLAPYVYEFWQYDVDPAQDYVPVQVFPSGCVSLRFNVRADGVESVLYGPCLSNDMKGLFFADWVIFGAALHAHRAYHLLGVAVAELRDLRIHMDCLWPNRLGPVEQALREAHTFPRRVQVFAAFLRRILRRDVAPHPEFLNVFTDIVRAAPAVELGSLARRYGTNGRSLRRQFARYLGLGPKQMNRVIRVQRCIRAIAEHPGVSLVELAMAHGFSDQAHFTREFKSLVGHTPRVHGSLVGRMHDKSLAKRAGMDPSRPDRPSARVVRFR